MSERPATVYWCQRCGWVHRDAREDEGDQLCRIDGLGNEYVHDWRELHVYDPETIDELADASD